MEEINSEINAVPAGARRRITSTNETIRDLLIRLPVKFLLRLRSVCWAWSGLLRSSSFILDNLNYHSNNNPLLIIQRFHWDQQSSCGLELEFHSQKVQEFHVPRVTDSDLGFKIVGSCNGLLCVCHYSHDPSSCLFLWNLATRQIRRIPEHSNALLPHKASPYCLLGFVYNARVNDYEVVRIYTSESNVDVGIHAVQIEMFSLNSGLWKEVEYYDHHDATAVNGPFVWVENFVTVKRNMFWVAMSTRQRFSGSNEFIVSFDAQSKMLRKMSVPNLGNNDFEVSKKLIEYGESLGVLILSESANMDHSLELCVHDDDCWIKIKTIGLVSNMDRPVGLWNKDEVFIASGNVIHGVKSGLKAVLPSSAHVADDCCYVSLNYEESLVDVNGGTMRQINHEEDEHHNDSKEDYLAFVRVFKKLIGRVVKNKLDIKRLMKRSAIMKSLTKSFNNVKFYLQKFFIYIRML